MSLDIECITWYDVRSSRNKDPMWGRVRAIIRILQYKYRYTISI
jgi:hypothetical protein